MLAPFFWFNGTARNLQSRAFILEFFVSPRWGSSFSQFIFPRVIPGVIIVTLFQSFLILLQMKMTTLKISLQHQPFAAYASLRDYFFLIKIGSTRRGGLWI